MLAILSVPVAAVNLTLGSISGEPANELKYYLPVANYLAEQLQTVGIDKGNVVVAQNIKQMAGFIKEGKVDLYMDSPFPTLEVSQLSGSLPLLRRWKKGIGSYHSVVFVRQDSGIKSPDDLRGKVIAFEAPYSTSSYFLPKASLSKLGMKLVEVADPKSRVNAEEIGYSFTDDDENTLFWVLRKRTQAGAMSAASFKKLAARRIKKLSIVYSTLDVPRHIVSFRKDLDPALVTQIKKVLLKMHESKSGRKILHQFKKTTRFDEFPGGADVALKPLYELNNYLH